ncbi:hypothetical protein NDU88_007074 [Pleurodeles waltl]|uniref:Uncharacterized protein n=1 Tax=Pleurodeles waltl TaxID=8319 RepID=A0AAV7N4X6_PLEWA|nr:hypothetical protein NDU88_007074 [Pleurodeles waltl]
MHPSHLPTPPARLRAGILVGSESVISSRCERATKQQCYYSLCSRLSVDTAPASEWRCSRGRVLSVSHYHDHRGAGVSNVNPDFRVRVNSKREDGRENASKEPDAGDFLPIGTPDTERNDQENPTTRTENPDSVRTAGGTRNQEPREDTLSNRHVPGGAWLTKISLLSVPFRLPLPPAVPLQGSAP